MFHTTYSLIFVTMLRDYFWYTADSETVRRLFPTVELLFSRFDTYLEKGIVENPPNYMFVDWGELHGYSMHHPPKALGQTVLNAFYQMALCAAAELASAIGESMTAQSMQSRANTHCLACRERFWDAEKQLFFDGMPRSVSEYAPNLWLPENADRIYHTRHANILAALCGFAQDGKGLIERVITSPDAFEDFDIQPYFMHYLLEATRKYGLFAEHGLSLLHLWDRQLAESPKGMKEGWGKFKGDHSHAWGATPTYQLPVAFSGFTMCEPGYRAFRLCPQRYGLSFAKITLPTPFGLIRITLEEEAPVQIECPSAFELVTSRSGVWEYHLREK